MFQGRRVFFMIAMILTLVFVQIACSTSAPKQATSVNEKSIKTEQAAPTTKELSESKSEPKETEELTQNRDKEAQKPALTTMPLQQKAKTENGNNGVEGGVEGGVVGGVVGGTLSSADSAVPPPPIAYNAPAAAAPVAGKIATGQSMARPMSIPAGQPMAVKRTQDNVEKIKEDPQGTEDYTKYSINKMTNTKEDRFSTFSIDVDTGSYTIARRKLNEGYLPPAQAVRVEEFINYFQYKYPQPATDNPFSVTMEASVSPFNQERHLLRIGVKGKTVEAAQRPTAHLTFLVDTSGSMQSEDKIGLLKESLRILVENLKPTDTVAISTYAGGIRLVLPPTAASNKDVILKSLYGLQAGGGTAMASGIELAYQQALFQLQEAKKGDINRVIICSDGDANIGNTSPTEILKQMEHYVKQGITVSTIGFGMGNYKDSMMEQFANKGNGNYFYIDNLQEAKKVFQERLTSNLQVIAKDVKIQVEFDPSTVAKYRLVGYENRDIADKDFRNDKVDAGEIGPGHTVTALYELELQPQATNNLATVRLRYKAPDGEKAKEVATAFSRDRVQPLFNRASEDFRFTVAVAAFAESLRGSKDARTWSLNSIANIAKESNSTKMEERQEFVNLVNRAQQLKTHLAPQQ